MNQMDKNNKNNNSSNSLGLWPMAADIKKYRWMQNSNPGHRGHQIRPLQHGPNDKKDFVPKIFEAAVAKF